MANIHLMTFRRADAIRPICGPFQELIEAFIVLEENEKQLSSPTYVSLRQHRLQCHKIPDPWAQRDTTASGQRSDKMNCGIFSPDPYVTPLGSTPTGPVLECVTARPASFHTLKSGCANTVDQREKVVSQCHLQLDCLRQDKSLM